MAVAVFRLTEDLPENGCAHPERNRSVGDSAQDGRRTVAAKTSFFSFLARIIRRFRRLNLPKGQAVLRNAQSLN